MKLTWFFFAFFFIFP
ncbi:hypothetical protein DR39_14080 [Salmonella enterica subsp. enterica serovar Senftenberg]|nr:hypothetical protein [Salmonella enterica subsp. enterica serovar Senftenberg]